MKSEVDRVRAKCGWPGCPWLFYAAKTSRCSRFQVITYEDEHRCAQNKDNKLVTAKVIAQRYEHFILANPMWKVRRCGQFLLTLGLKLQDMYECQAGLRKMTEGEKNKRSLNQKK
jgi:hypothetical protein